MTYDPRDPVPVQPVQTGAVAPVTTTRRTTLARSFTIAAAAGAIFAMALIILGAVALVRTDLESPLDEPVVEVAGFTQNAVLGIVEIAAGVLLLLAALSRSRGAILFFSIIIGIGAVVALIEPEVGGGSLPIERSLAAIIAIAAAVVALTAALVPSIRRTTQYVETV